MCPRYGNMGGRTGISWCCQRIGSRLWSLAQWYTHGACHRWFTSPSPPFKQCVFTFCFLYHEPVHPQQVDQPPEGFGQSRRGAVGWTVPFFADESRPGDLEALVRQQAAELEGLRRRLEKAKLASPKTPRLTTEASAEIRGRERLAGWMKQTAESLEQYVQQVPRADMEGTEDLTSGEVLANRVWDTLWDSHKAYEGRQRAREDAESAEGSQLDALQWSHASAHPTDSFRW